MIDAFNNLEELIEMFEKKEKMVKEANMMWEQMEEKKGRLGQNGILLQNFPRLK